ncbi:uncharacterized protein [Solanum lycopersicum]|uniref:uncharacterized protein n=1 Tax=Solanum lycopersicum TaxID=4081 RepID=UPI0037485474
MGDIQEGFFFDRFFPREKREAKVMEFINLHQGDMSVFEYSLNSLIVKVCSFLVMGESDDLQEECHSAMRYENMNISRLMVHDQQVEHTRAKRKSRDANRARSFDGISSKSRLDIHEKPRFKKRSSNTVFSKFSKARDDRVSNPSLKREVVIAYQTRSQLVESMARSIMVIAQLGQTNFFGCGKSSHKVRDNPNVKGKDKGSRKTQTSGSKVDPPKKNKFYALRSRGEQESSPDVVTGMLQVFSIDVYALLDPSATLSFVTPLIARKFDILPDILNEPFMVTTPVDESVVAKRVYKNCPIILPNRVTHVELVELDMVDFHVILGMDWLRDCFTSIDYKTRIVKFNF